MDQVFKEQLAEMKEKGWNDCQIVASAISGYEGVDCANSAKDDYYYSINNEYEKYYHIMEYANDIYEIELTTHQARDIRHFLDKEYKNASERDHAFTEL